MASSAMALSEMREIARGSASRESVKISASWRARLSEMKMTGHRTEAVYRRYAIAEAAMRREAAVKLAARHAVKLTGRNARVTQKSAPQMTSHNDLPFKNSAISRMFSGGESGGMADALDLGSSAARRAGSSPASRTSY